MSPRLPGETQRQRQNTQNGGTWIALVFVFAVIAGLIALTSQIMPQVTGLILVVAGLFFFIAFHYFTWGRWLMARMERLQEEEADH